MTAVSWSADKQDSPLAGTLDLQFRLFDDAGTPTFSFEMAWEDHFQPGKSGKPWIEQIGATRVAAQCEVGLCAKDKMVVLRPGQFTASASFTDDE